MCHCPADWDGKAVARTGKSEDLPATCTEFPADREGHDSADNRDIPDRFFLFFGPGFFMPGLQEKIP